MNPVIIMSITECCFGLVYIDLVSMPLVLKLEWNHICKWVWNILLWFIFIFSKIVLHFLLYTYHGQGRMATTIFLSLPVGKNIIESFFLKPVWLHVPSAQWLSRQSYWWLHWSFFLWLCLHSSFMIFIVHFLLSRKFSCVWLRAYFARTLIAWIPISL